MRSSFNLFEFLHNNPDFASFLQQVCEQNNCYKITSNAIVTRCPICGDSTKHKVNHGHLYLYENGFAICFRCNWRSNINRAIFELTRKLRIPYPEDLKNKLDIATNRLKRYTFEKIEQRLKEATLSEVNNEFTQQYKKFLQSILNNSANCFQYYSSQCNKIAELILTAYDYLYEVYSKEFLQLEETNYVLQRINQPEKYRNTIKNLYEDVDNLLYTLGYIPGSYFFGLLSQSGFRKEFFIDKILQQFNWTEGKKACFLSQTGLLLQCRAVNENAKPKYMTIHLAKYHKKLSEYWQSLNKVIPYLRSNLREHAEYLPCLLQKYLTIVPPYELWLTLFGRKSNYKGLLLAEGIFDLINPFALHLILQKKLYPIAVLGRNNFQRLFSLIPVNNTMQVYILSDSDTDESFWANIANKSSLKSIVVLYNTLSKDFNSRSVKPVTRIFRRRTTWKKRTFYQNQ